MRRHLQVVVRDPHAVAWLSSHPGDGDTSKPNDKGEIILQGLVKNPVYSPRDFVGFTHLGYFVTDRPLPHARVRREGHGLRVSMVSWVTWSEVEKSNWHFDHCPVIADRDHP